MGAMDVGWSDLGSWTALLAGIGAGHGRVVQAGETAIFGPDDLVVHASAAGRLVVARVRVRLPLTDRPPCLGGRPPATVVEP